LSSKGNGDKELEMIGMIFINIFKGIFNFLQTSYYGIRKLNDKKSNKIVLGVTTAIGIGLFLLRQKIWPALPIDHEKMKHLRYAFYGVPGLPLLYLYWLGEEYAKFIADFDNKFESIGFFGKGKKKKRNLNGEIVESKDYPRFLGAKKEGKKVIYSFRSLIPLDEWKNRNLELESALDCNIVRIENAKTTKQVIRLHVVPTDQGLSEYLPWSDEYIKDSDFEILVGAAMLEDVSFDLNKVPHALIAGVTGSGKSVLLRCMLWQAIKKGARIFMIDFKGGVEFGTVYEYFGEVVTERQRAVEILKELVVENSERLKKFREIGVKNLAEYNEIAKEPLCRIILVCDEVGEMLDKTGLSKEDKQVYGEIEKEMSTLARLSRAPGINMILATQRPDARVIPGQIKNNLPIRISGRMVDQQASEMVLGNTKATKISDTRGRFMYTVGADTVEFQAYVFDDSQLIEDNYQIGKMLTQDIRIPGEPKAKPVDLEKANEKVDSKLEDEEDDEVSGLFNFEYEGFEVKPRIDDDEEDSEENDIEEIDTEEYEEDTEEDSEEYVSPTCTELTEEDKSFLFENIVVEDFKPHEEYEGF